MTEYLLSVHGDESQAQPIPEVIKDMYRDVEVVNQRMRDEGVWVFAGGLHPSNTATVVSNKKGDVLTTDGPYMEVKEQLGGFWVIKVDDLDAALSWAADASGACQAPVEVRPFQGS